MTVECGPVDFSVGHTRDRSRRPLLVCFRPGGKHLESTSHTFNCWYSPKNHVSHTGNGSETAFPAMSYHVGKPSKMTGPASPDVIIWHMRSYRAVPSEAGVFSQRISTIWGLRSWFQPSIFHRGSNKPEVNGSLCCGRVFSMYCDCPRTAQLISAVEHKRVRSGRPRSGRPLPVGCPHTGKRRESTSHVSNSWNSSKNHVLHTSNWSETAPPAISYQVGKPLKTTGPTLPNVILWRKRPADVFSRLIDCLTLADTINFKHFPLWRQQTGSGSVLEWFPVRRTCFFPGWIATVWDWPSWVKCVSKMVAANWKSFFVANVLVEYLVHWLSWSLTVAHHRWCCL